MPTASQTIEFEGYFADRALCIFKIIRGFTNLRDLDAISVLYELNEKVEPWQTFHLADSKPFIWPKA